VCRQGRLAGTLMTVVMGSLLVGGTIFWWRVGAPWFVTGPCALISTLIVPLLWGDVRARFRATNWTLWIQPDSLFINVRSYQDRSADDVISVVHINYRDIASVSKHIETSNMPDSEGDSRRSKLTSLDIRLTHPDTKDLASALKANRHRAQPERVSLGFIRVRDTPSNFVVSLPEDDVIRIAWRGEHTWIAPSLPRTLASLEGRVAIGETSRRDGKALAQLSEADLDDRIVSLVQAGDRIGAITLLESQRGYSTTDACTFVDALTERV